MKLLGLETQEWVRVYQLYKHTTGEEPKDLSDLHSFWCEEGYVRTPTECIHIAMKLIQCEDIPADAVRGMVRKFLDNT